MMQLAERKRRQAPTHASTERSPSTPAARSPVSPLALRSPIIQPQLTVNQPGDRYEQEADAVARAVMSGTPERSQPTSGQATIQRLAEEDQDVLQRQTLDEMPVQRLEEDQDVLQRQTLDEMPVQRQGNGQPAVSARTAATIRNPGTGAPLPASTRRRIEPHVGANLSGVRVHSDANAHRAANSLQARAFTHGQHIFLNRSESSHNLSLMAHEATHVVQQGAAPIQRQPLIQRVPAIEHSPKGSSHPPEIQRFIPDAVLEELADYARYIPGYTLFTVIIGYDPLRGVDVERNATNLLEGLMGLVPFGTAIFDALQEYGVIQGAFDWVSGELRRLDLSLSRIERTIEDAWDDVRLIEGFDYNLAVVQRHFQRLYDDVVDFATSLVNHIIELIKEAAIEFAEPLLADNRAWALIKKIIKYDPLRDVPVEATTVEILEDFLVLIGKEQELEQMRERGTLQETADWLDTQFALFVSLIGQLRGLITEAWNAIQPENLPDLGTNLENLAEGVGTFLEDVWTFASTVALKVLELIKNALLGWLSTFANDIPGFHLLTVILEQNPFTQEAVPRNATNLIRGFMSLMPGGERQFQQMQETGVIPQAAQRIEGMMTELGITWPFVQRLFLDLWDAFTIDDLLSPIDAFTRILDEFREPLNRLFTFVIEVIKVALELILALMNFPTDLIGSIITNALQALDDIQRDPVGFLINLLNTAKLGFQKFFDNILEHLIGGLTNWLFRTVREAGIEPPADLSFESILGFVLEVLGLTMDHMWELLANHIGQERVDQIRGMIDRVVELARDAWGFIQDVQERGIVAVWEYIQSQLTNLWDVVLEQVQSYVMERVVIVGMRWLLSLLDATGITPVINSFIAFFNAIQSAIEYLRDMLEVVNDFVSTVASIAAGDIEPGATRMEQGLGNSIPIVIGFIANQLGLGNISERLGEIIESIRAMVDRALNWLIEQALNLGRQVFDMLAGTADQTPQERLDNAVNDAVGVVNRYAGRSVGRVVLTPLLASIRLRYRLTSLEVIQQGEHWAVSGTVNPSTIRQTQAMVGDLQVADQPAGRVNIPNWPAVEARLRHYIRGAHVAVNNTIARIGENLQNLGAEGQRITEHLVNNTFGDAHGFDAIVRQLENPEMARTSYVVLLEALRYHRDIGIAMNRLHFEISEAQDPHDIDFAVVDRRGRFSDVYQIKRTSSLAGIINNLNLAIGEVAGFHNARAKIAIYADQVTRNEFETTEAQNDLTYAQRTQQIMDRHTSAIEVDIIFIPDSTRIRYS
jgi:phage-related protein